MRQQDRRTLGGLVLIGVAVWIAAWLLGPGEGGATGDGERSAADSAHASLPAATDAAIAAPVDAPAPAPLLDAQAAAAAALLEAGQPGEPLHLTGRIIDTDRQPIAGALVLHWPSEAQRAQIGLDRDAIRDGIPWERLVSARSDADGRFALDVRDETLGLYALAAAGLRPEFADVIEARPILVVEHPGHATATEWVTAERPGDVDVGEIVLSPEVALVGRVVDAAGTPLAGARLDVGLAGDHMVQEERVLKLQLAPLGTVSDDAGRFRITGLWPGKFNLGCAAPGRALRMLDLDIDQPGVRDLGDVRLEAGVQVAGHVVDGSGRPLAGARVRVRPAVPAGSGPDSGSIAWGLRWETGGRTLQTEVDADAQGAFRVDGLWPDFPTLDVLARADGFDAGILPKVAPGAEDLVLKLEPQATWRLRIVAAGDGSPVPGATVRALRQGGEKDVGRGELTADVVDGAFVLRGASRTRTDAVASAPGCATRVVALPGLAAGEVREQTLELSRELVLAGRVVDDEDAPLAGASVRLTPPDELAETLGERALRADLRGRFRFDGLSPGEWSLKAGAHGVLPMGRARIVELVAGVTPPNVELVLPRGGTITGLVSVVGGGPMKGARVDAQSKSPEAADACARAGQIDDGASLDHPAGTCSVQGFTGGDGRFTLAGVAPGEWKVDAGEGAEAMVQMVGRETVEVALTRPQPPRVIGHVTRSGVAMPGALVELGYGPDIGNAWIRLAATRTDPNGNYELEYAADETWYLQATADGITSRAVKVALTWNHTEEVDIALPTGRVRGRVVDGTGAGVGGVQLALGEAEELAKRNEDPFGQATTSAPDGSFTFEPVGAGTWLLLADPGNASYSAPARQTVTLVEGQPLSDVTVALQPGATVEVTAVSSAKLRVGLRPPEGGGGEAYPKRTSEGTYVFSRLAAGEWELTVQRLENKKWPLVHSEKVNLSPGQTLQVQVQLTD